ncbi:MAG: efflux RND transporter periplasmic adaptor subunit [Verrucomicrobia bacterium]|nr:efflux RND transporter periplasmic adaptor subunit [Verrucomicrobiota bacterium]MBU6446516.1 efflux RND transporter periplasmic adaptor subunit [Verrucomicrobiota bacterium]MDE3047789.1 efflux RND transporter periplasmic adaptor subunit [Verrucomicrobiota bacterium]
MRDRILKLLFCIGCVTIAILVTYFILKEKKEDGELTLYGNVDVRLVDIGFRVPGRVQQLFFEEGDLVKEGQLMCLLDKTPYDAEYNQAAANVNATLANLKLSEILLKRRKELIGIGGVSQEDVDSAQANFDQLVANLQLSEASLAVQRDNLTYTEVLAPTDGIILSRIREPGTVVNPGDPVYTLSVLSPVWIRAFVDEPDLGKIYYGMPAEITTDTKDAPVYKGQIGFISPMAEFTPKTVETTQLRTDLVYRLRIYAENPDWRLKQGMPVTVKLRPRK